MHYKVTLDNIWKVKVIFLKIFLNRKPLNIRSFLFGKLHLRHWSFVKQKVFSKKKCYYMISGKFVSGITNKDFYPSALKYLTYCLPGCTNPCFLVAKKKNQSCEILVPKIQQVMFLILSSYFVNILPNYLIFSNLAHFSISRYLFLVI